MIQSISGSKRKLTPRFEGTFASLALVTLAAMVPGAQANPILWYIQDSGSGHYISVFGPTYQTSFSFDSGAQLQQLNYSVGTPPPLGPPPLGGSRTDVYCAGAPTGCVTYTGSAALYSSISPGEIHGYASASGSVSNNTNDPFVQYNASGAANFDALWLDTITVGGLPAGTPVDLMFTDNLHSVLTGGALGDISAIAHSQLEVSGLSRIDIFNDVHNSPRSNISESEVLHTVSGATITIDGLLILSASAGVGPGGALSASATADASNTNDTLINVLTPGASYSAASGTVYSQLTTTPEPSSGTLFLLAGGLLAVVRRRLT
jgi:hypothetical protein